MSKPLAVFTTQTFSQTSLQPGGAVFVNRVEIINVGKNPATSEGRNILMEKKINELTRSLMGDLDIQAKKMYPTSVALVNVDIRFSEIGTSNQTITLLGQASATAVIRRVKPVGQTLISPGPSAAPALGPAAPALGPVAPALGRAPPSALPSAPPSAPPSALPSALPSARPSSRPSARPSAKPACCAS